MPVPGSGVNDDLSNFDALRKPQGSERRGDTSHTESEMQRVCPSNQVKEVATWIGAEINAFRGELPPCNELAGDE